MALKRHLVGGVVVVAGALVLAGCSRDNGPEAPADFCRAAARYEKELEDALEFVLGRSR